MTAIWTASIECALNEAFVEMLPTIRRVAQHAFRHLRTALREELIAETVANSFAALRRLFERGCATLAYPTALARFAICQIRQGRRVGSSLNANDVMSPYAQQRNCIHVESLSQRKHSGAWEDVLVEDKRATPADVAACRVDFRDWLSKLNRLQRAIALKLAAGESTSAAAVRFGLSRGRVSQLRSELKRSWERFQSETSPPRSICAA